MGYTHYWDLKNYRGIKDDFSKAIPELRGVLEFHKDIIQYEHDDSKPPELTDNKIHLNGKGDEGAETFFFTLKKGDSCKTYSRPYDVVVCSCLLVLSKYLKKFKYSSEGEVKDWKEASEFTGVPVRFNTFNT